MSYDDDNMINFMHNREIKEGEARPLIKEIQDDQFWKHHPDSEKEFQSVFKTLQQWGIVTKIDTVSPCASV